MKNLFESRPIRQAATIIGTIGITVLLLMECQRADAQVRLAGGIGVGHKPYGILQAGYAYKQYDAVFEINRGLISLPTYFGLTPGYTIGIVRLYGGPFYKVTGHRSSQDRYVHDGTTTVLSSGYETNHFVFGAGVNLQHNHIVVDAGYRGEWKAGIMWSLK